MRLQDLATLARIFVSRDFALDLKFLAGHRIDLTMASFHPSPSKPRLRLPRGACDTHFHVFGPRERFPYAADRSYTPVPRRPASLHGTSGRRQPDRGMARISRQATPWKDAIPFARKLVAEFGSRALWDTDWPHPNLKEVPDDGLLVDLIGETAPTEAQREAQLVGNPQRFYGFEK
jgi:predicted TIM-barrel fold metal-dependent hydrolase